MINKYSVLIIEDHPLITEAYKSAFEIFQNSREDIEFEIDTASDCDIAKLKIEKYASMRSSLDLCLLDIKLPPSHSDEAFRSGEELGVLLRKKIPESKIIICTLFDNGYRIHNLVKSINPDGFLVKRDITSDELTMAIETVLDKPPYYSKTVVDVMRKQLTTNFGLDEIDRKILYELSIGTKTKDLPRIVDLSMGGVEKRKRQLKAVFNVNKQGDRSLILSAKKNGFL